MKPFNQSIVSSRHDAIALKHGFTLLELSIVLVIIGLVVAGILVGRDLIRAGELKKLYGEYQALDIAANAYKLKYNALAGDHVNAYNFFGDDCGTDTTDLDTGCNGNDDKIIGDVDSSTDDYGEEPKFFQHLSFAGLVAGDYDGSCGGLSDGCDYAAGVNVPISSWSGGVWGILYAGCEECKIAARTHNVFMMSGAKNSGGFPSRSFDSQHNNPLLTVHDMWSIDSKYDDGLPNNGKITTFGFDATWCVSDQISATSTYNLTTATEKCTPYFRMTGF